jgi:hypothetical protein
MSAIRKAVELEEELNSPIYYITEGTVQEYAKRRIGRELAYDELYIATKCIHAGLSFDIDTVFNTAIDEAVELSE